MGDDVGFDAIYKRFEVMTLSGSLPVTLWNKYEVLFLSACSMIDIGGFRKVVGIVIRANGVIG